MEEDLPPVVEPAAPEDVPFAEDEPAWVPEVLEFVPFPAEEDDFFTIPPEEVEEPWWVAEPDDPCCEAEPEEPWGEADPEELLVPPPPAGLAGLQFITAVQAASVISTPKPPRGRETKLFLHCIF